MFIKNEKNIKTRAVKIYNLIFVVVVLAFMSAFIYFLFEASKTDFVVITIVLAFILFGFIHFYKELVENYLKISAQLNVFETVFNGVKTIEDFKKEYSNIGQTISKREYISDIWWEFCETLIIKREKPTDKTPQSFDIIDNPIIILKNTAQIESYINENNFVDLQVRKNFIDSIPGILTGLGLLGTFTAIALALFGFNLEQIDASIEQLLGGLTVKFISSIAGILTSLLFLYIMNKLCSNMKMRLCKLQIKLNKLLPRRTAESYLCDILEYNMKHSKDLEILLNSANEQEKLLTQMKDNTNLILSSLGSIYGVLYNADTEETVFEKVESLGNDIEDLGNTIKRFLTDADFINTLKNAVSEGISGAKADLTDAINTSLDRLDTIKNEIFNKMETIKTELINTLNSLNSSIASSISGSMNNSLENLNNNLGNAIGNLSDALETFKNLKQQSSADIMEKMINELKQCMTDMRENFQKQILDGSGDTISSLQNNLKEASSYLANVQSTFTGFMENLMAQQANENQVRNEAVSQTINSTVKQVSEVNQSIQSCIDSQNTQLNEWLNTIKSYVDEIHANEMGVKDSYAEVLTQLNNSLDRQTNTIDNLSSVSNKLITSSDKLEKSSALVADVTDKTNDTANNIAQSLSDSKIIVGQLQDSMKSIQHGITNLNNEYDRLHNQLVNSISEFADKSCEFQGKMVDKFTGHLNDTIQSIQGASEEMQDIVENLSTTIDRMYK